MKMVMIGVLLLIAVTTVARADTPFTVPEGFELQRLDVTEGRIAKPKGWFYSYGGDRNSIVWTISKEDTSKGPYKTGQKIQFAPAVSHAAKMTPQAFVAKFLVDKKKAEKVVKECAPQSEGQFMRACLETLEVADTFGRDIQFHILYSVFWSNDNDAIVLTTFGTPEQDWEKERHNADQMAQFELLGEGFWKK